MPPKRRFPDTDNSEPFDRICDELEASVGKITMRLENECGCVLSIRARKNIICITCADDNGKFSAKHPTGLMHFMNGLSSLYAPMDRRDPTLTGVAPVKPAAATVMPAGAPKMPDYPPGAK